MATVCAGFLATKILLVLHVENVMLRYPFAVIFAYLIFFISLKLWLKYVAFAHVSQKLHNNSSHLSDVLPGMPGSGSPSGSFQAGDVFAGGGGEFSGAGASGSFADFQSAFADCGSGVLSGGIDAGDGIGDVVGDAVGGVAEGLGEEGGIVAIVVCVVLATMMAVVVGAGVYLFYEAPFILSEAAFEFILAASLVRGTKRIDRSDWRGSVFKTTSIPFFITLALATLAGYLMHHYFPDVTRISDLIFRL